MKTMNQMLMIMVGLCMSATMFAAQQAPRQVGLGGDDPMFEANNNDQAWEVTTLSVVKKPQALASASSATQTQNMVRSTTPFHNGRVTPVVLVVDDQKVNRLIAQKQLTQKFPGCTVLIAEDGDVAVRVVSSAAEPIDAVVMDVDMPNKDGVTATAEIRKTHSADILPIIFHSTLPDSAVNDKCKSAGAMGFHVLQKPTTPDQLHQAIITVTTQAAHKRAASQQLTNNNK